MVSLSFRVLMGLAMPLGKSQAWLAEEFRAIVHETPLWYGWLSSLVVFLLWLPLRVLFVGLFWLAMQTAEGRSYQQDER